MRWSNSKIFDFLIFPIFIVGFGLWLNSLHQAGVLPEPMAIHWGWTGKADGFATFVEYFSTAFAFIGISYFSLLALKFSIRSKLISGLVAWIFRILTLFLILLFTVTTSIQIGASSSAQSSFPNLLFALLLLIIPASIWILLAFPRVVIGNSVRVNLRCLSVLDLPISEIKAATVTKIRPRDFGGFGLRIKGKKIALVPNSGPALKLELISGEQVLIRSDNPEFLAESIMDSIR
jgi:hypothetical protein